MKCGMVRKVDELGRVVIPKEIRRILNIKTGSSIEMFIEKDNQIVLKKFSEVKNILDYTEILLELVGDLVDCPIFVCDEDEIIGCKNTSKKDYIGRKIETEKLENMGGKIFDILNLKEYKKSFVFGLKSSGFVCGYVVLCCKEDLKKDIIENIEILTKFISKILEY